MISARVDLHQWYGKQGYRVVRKEPFEAPEILSGEVLISLVVFSKTLAALK